MEPGWRVLLLGGSSGVGKSHAAETIARRVGGTWMQVDDLRLALMHSRPTLPDGREWALHYFQSPERWRDPAAIRDVLVVICEVLAPAVEIVTANHVRIRTPLVIEGDGIHPAVVERESVRGAFEAGLARAVFVLEDDEAAILENMLARDRDAGVLGPVAMPGWARGSWLHGRWLRAEAERRGLPVVPPRPWETLVDRILAAAG